MIEFYKVQKLFQNKYILWLILLAAAILRFYHLTQIPFTHDEFSALFRTQFDSFGELINKGVRIDGHPAGIQVFLYYYTHLFGTKAWVVKLPFLISGLLSVWLLYKIGKIWFNESVGLISAAFLASSQIAVMYSQIARPYASGLFFVLAMVYFWSGLILKPEKKIWRNRILFVLYAALCAYNHYFSLLFALILGLIGIFWVKPKNRWAYIASGVAIFLLFLPHFSIFLFQIQIGGVEDWLHKPTPYFVSDYLRYTFNYFSVEYLMVAALVLFGFWKFKRADFAPKRFLLFSLLFMAPLIIGYLYSVNYSAVLQFSVLIFSTPFLFFVLFGHIRKQKPATNFILVILILSIGTVGLIFVRHHYSIFYQSENEHILTDYRDAKSEHPNLAALILSDAKITDYYASELSIDTNYVDLLSFSGKPELIAFLEEAEKIKDYLYLGCISSIDPTIVPIIKDHFSQLIWQKNYFTGTTYLFSKSTKRSEQLITRLDFESPAQNRWQNIVPSQVEDTVFASPHHAYHVKKQDEWSISYTIPLDSIMVNENNFIDISVDVSAELVPADFLLVATLDSEEKNIYWGSSAAINFVNPQYPTIWTRVHHSIKLSDIDLHAKNIDFKCFLWNNNFQEFFIDNFQISLRRGNPIIYGLYEPIPNGYIPK